MTVLTIEPNGTPMHLHKREGKIAKCWEAGRPYEAPLLDRIYQQNFRGVAIDAGANIGNHTLWLAVVCGLDVVAFEPILYEVLRSNIALNQVDAKVEVQPVALGASSGWASEVGKGRLTIDVDGGADGSAIPVRTLDSYGYRNVALIKADVEDMEPDVLRGGEATIRRDRPTIFAEAHDSQHDEVGAVLGPWGYQMVGVHNAEESKTPVGEWRHESDLGNRGLSNVRRDRSRHDRAQASNGISVAIMAHPARHELVEKLCEGLPHNTEVAWDERGDRWDTGRRALLAYDRSASHHLVLQDDAVLCRDLVAGVERAAAVAGNRPMVFYLGRGGGLPRTQQRSIGRAISAGVASGATWLEMAGPRWGVAVAIPTRDIPELVKWGDNLDIPNYDLRIEDFYVSKNRQCWYSMPSLVDHRSVDETRSLIEGRTGNRRARQFIGADSSALEIQWNTEAVSVNVGPARAVMEQRRKAHMPTMTRVRRAIRRSLGNPPKRRLALMLAASATLPLGAIVIALGGWKLTLVLVGTLQAVALILLLDARSRVGPAAALMRDLGGPKSTERREALERSARRVANAEYRVQTTTKHAQLEISDRLTELLVAAERTRGSVADLRSQYQWEAESLKSLRDGMSELRKHIAAKSAADLGHHTAVIDAHGTVMKIHDERPFNPNASRIIKCWRAGAPYEKALLEHIYDQRFDGLAVDVGANVGNHSLWFALVCGLDVVAFEPITADELKLNMELNGLAIPVERVALGAEVGWTSRGAGEGTLVGTEGDVPVRPLDSYNFTNVALIKIDVEGMEPAVLSGAMRTIERERPVIYTEAHGPRDHQAIANVLEEPGYGMSSRFHSKSVASPVEEWRWLPKRSSRTG